MKDFEQSAYLRDCIQKAIDSNVKVMQSSNE